MTRQSIKYESTTVEAASSVSELSDLIRGYGGSRFEQIWAEDGSVGGVRFAVRHPSLGEVPVAISARTVTIEGILREAGKWRSYPAAEREVLVRAQAERIAWRHLKDLTEQLLLAVRLGLKTLPEAFLSDVEVYDPASGDKTSMAALLESRSRRDGGGPLELGSVVGRSSTPHSSEARDAIEMPPAE